MSNDNQHQKSNTAIAEEKILQFWRDNDIFKKTLEQDSPHGEFVFYDGPPYATGEPHYGHLLGGTLKDVIPRYKTMQGYHVARRWGWDCHGLPIENLIEKELDLKSKKDIEDFGVDKFNSAARDSVLRYEQTWKEIIPRTGRWVDMENPYMTMTPNYMESVWWVFSQLHKKNLVNKGFKVMHLCPRCETTLSNFEVNQGYADVKDITATAKFKVIGQDNTYFLAWTTTPWTLPGNVTLAVGEDIDYVYVRENTPQSPDVDSSPTPGEQDALYIVAKKLVEKVFTDKEYEIIKTVSGSELVGTKYEPIFDYYSKNEKLENRENGWRVYSADFVTTDSGTGIVHIAPAFGSDDAEMGKKHKLPFVQHVDKSGAFKPEVTDFAGIQVKKAGDTMTADIEVIKWLAHNDRLIHKEKITHIYPLCWRCDTPLLNYATDSWFIDVPSIRDRLVENNKKTNWVPEHMQSGRFGKWLGGAREWAVSRSRYWGTPLPVWEKQGGGHVVIGSVDDLKKYTKKSGNKYFFMRHALSINNEEKRASSIDADGDILSDKAKEQINEQIDKIKDINPDIVIHSPLNRTTLTAEQVAEQIAFSGDINSDERIREISFGVYEDKPLGEWLKKRDSEYHFDRSSDGGESYRDVTKRVGDLIYEIEKKHKNKTILLVGHGVIGEVLNVLCNGFDDKQAWNHIGDGDTQNAEIRQYDFVPLPHNENYELDLHRPYIDDIELVDENDNPMKRVSEVFDVWFDSGSMPYAQQHFMGGSTPPRFPADFVAEGQDQTRGWFYVMSVLGTALYDQAPFKNIVVNGTVLAEDGKKMSKRLKNYPDVSYVLDKYGADAMRLFLMSSPGVHGDDVNFIEKSVGELANKVLGRLRNVVSFYGLYKEQGAMSSEQALTSPNILDKWILARLAEANIEITGALDDYLLDRGARAIADFVDDLSTWYIRRSRDRMKNSSPSPESGEVPRNEAEGSDKQFALATTKYILIEFSKLIAPYIPFVADEVYQSITTSSSPDVGEVPRHEAEGYLESVHLENWPTSQKTDTIVFDEMKKTRELITELLSLRKENKVNVRQPLASATININLADEYLELIKDELNVKEVLVGEELSLDLNLTDELRAEGAARELIREIQKMRKDAGLNPDDKIKLTLSDDKKDIYEGFADEIQNTAGVADVAFGSEVKIDKI